MLKVWNDVDDNRRCGLFTGMYRGFTFETIARMLVFANEDNYYYNTICKKPGRQYPSENICAYNVADTLIETLRYMRREISPDSNDWVWSNFVTTRFRNTPWSHVP